MTRLLWEQRENGCFRVNCVISGLPSNHTRGKPSYGRNCTHSGGGPKITLPFYDHKSLKWLT